MLTRAGEGGMGAPRAGLDVARTWARRFVVNTRFPWVASRANMLYLAAHTHNRAAVCLHTARITALRAFWTDWQPTETHLYHKSSTPGWYVGSSVVIGAVGPEDEGAGVLCVEGHGLHEERERLLEQARIPHVWAQKPRFARNTLTS